MKTNTTRGEAVTIYRIGEFGMGVNKAEGWLLDHGRRPYAQYEAAPWVKWVPKGKRNPRGWQGGYRPYCVVLRGHGLALDPGSSFDPCPSGDVDVECSRSRYCSFDDRWATDFDAQLAAYCARHPDAIVADYRK